MQDTNNLKKKLKFLKRNAEASYNRGDDLLYNYFTGEIYWINKILEARKNNKKKNAKQYKKANGHYPKN